VLLDLGAINDSVQGAIARQTARHCRLDGVIMTAPAAAAFSPSRLLQSAPELATICLGMIENPAAA
jgi:hypothetical protein